MKKLIAVLLILMIAAALLAGCSIGKDKGNEYQVYYLNIEGTSVEEETIFVDAELTGEDQLVEYLLGKLAEEPEDANMRRTLTDDICKPQVTFESSFITLDFPEAYAELEASEEILVRAAVVLTLTQIEGIDSVNILVNGQKLRYASGALIGRLSADDFLENPGQQINGSLEDTVTLYFSDTAGTGLVSESRTVHYSSNESLEKTIVKLLIDGPQITGAQETIPGGTNIINVTVADGICYVNLDDTFRNDQNTEIAEQVVLYSIVDSLTELDSVEKVQISVNGDSNGKVRYIYELNQMYVRDLSLLDPEPEENTSTEEAITEPTGNESGPAGGNSGVINTTSDTSAKSGDKTGDKTGDKNGGKGK